MLSFRLGAVGLAWLLAISQSVQGQGVTTAAIRGAVRATDGTDVDGARVRVVSRSTGYTIERSVSHGRFLVQGLEVGGPYTVLVSRLGFVTQQRDSVFLTLGQRLELDFVLTPTALPLDTVHVETSTGLSALSRARSGTGSVISDTLLRRLPALNRHAYDFVRLVPQINTRFGISGGGVGFRFNSFVIDGVSQRQLQGNHVETGGAGGKTISMEAVKEYHVLLSPYDTRFGDFAGAMVNAVTKSGSNEPYGTMFGYTRNERFARDTEFLRNSLYDRTQFGLALGGPIVRDRAHFFFASEFQRHRQPASGPYVGQSLTTDDPLPVSESDITRFISILQDYGLEPGSGGRVIRSIPNTNVFARIDLSLPEWNSRVVLRHNHASFDNLNFSRSSSSQFRLSSNAATLESRRRTTTLQLFTQLAPDAFNELLVSYAAEPFGFALPAQSPLIQVTVPREGGGNATLVAGPPEGTQGLEVAQKIVEIADHLALRAGTAHTLGIGLRAELFSLQHSLVVGGSGRWNFSSLDALARGEAASYRLQKDFGSATKPLRGAQLSAYINEEWQPGDRLSLSAGLRADVLTFDTRPEYNPVVDSIFNRRTSDFPRLGVHWSPRFGFAWEIGPEGRNLVRGGAGVFVGRPPLGWFLRTLQFEGVGVKTLTCTGTGVPAFIADPETPPTSCSNGQGFRDGAVSLVDPDLDMAAMFRASIAYDRTLPWNVAASIEALYTRTLSDFVFTNMNLAGPTGIDRQGRVLYGTFDIRGQATADAVTSELSEVIDVRNHAKGYSWTLAVRLDKRFSNRVEASAAWAFSRVRDVQSLTSQSATAPSTNWAGGRTMSGRHEELSTGISDFEVPHRVILAATWTSPWKRWATDLSLYYVGESGFPFTYVDSAGGNFGDLNADGTNANDPIYVPTNAHDPSEIVFAGTTPEDLLLQQQAFEDFINGDSCLRRQRGRIVERNSCRTPWVHTTNMSLRQSLPALWGHGVSLHFEVHNLLNLINEDWGIYQTPNAAVLQHVGQTPGPVSEPVFRFDRTRPRYLTQNIESAYQIQLGLRYSF